MGLPITFNVGEKVVYPNHGVGTIENIASRTFGSQFERFYLLRLANCGGMTVMVPFSHVDDVGLRRVTRNCEIARVLTFLSSGRCRCSGDWKNRFRENSDKMRVGSLLDIAEVLKTLLVLQLEKPLSFREKKMLDRALQMLLAEFSICRGISASEAADQLRRALGKSALDLPEPL